MLNSPLAHIELSKKNLINNIKQLKSLAGKSKIIAVIKANAYGHGQNEVAKILAPHTDYFAINSFHELETLRKVTSKKTFVLGYVEDADLAKAIKLGSIISIFSLEQLIKINSAAKKLKKIQEVNVAIDAHLGREGILPDGLPEFLQALGSSRNIKLFGVYAHFANIEDSADFSHAQKQIDTYEKVVEMFKITGFKNFHTHISATSGLIIYDAHKNLHSIVRSGIGLYGLWPAKRLGVKYGKEIKLAPVLSWKTKIAQVKTLSTGSTIGYGLTFKTKKETKIAVIPQGYSDGFDRRFSNKGEVLIGGIKCKILGRVMMNMFVVDVSHLSKVKAEDEVILLGRQGKLEITAEELADQIGTINYEITTRINPLLPRIIK